MKCRSCQSPMVVSRRESSGNATTSWHQCPLCKQVRLTSEKEVHHSLDSASHIAQSDDDIAYAVDNEVQPRMAYLFT